MLIRHLFGTMELEARLYARGEHSRPVLMIADDEQPLELDRIEAVVYELVTATAEEMLQLEEAGYYLHRRSPRRCATVLSLHCA